MKIYEPKLTEYQLKRLSFVIRKKVLDAVQTEAPGLSLEVVASEIAAGLTLLIRADVLGLQKTTMIKLPIPDGPWQTLRALLGLSYQKRQIRINAYAIWPDLPSDQSGCKVYLDAGEPSPTGA